MSLFRPDASPRSQDRLNGQVHLALPLSWHLIGGALGCALVGTLVFCWVGTYSRVATVPGTIATDRGIVAVSSSRRGILASILVSDGQEVAAGQTLAQLDANDTMTSGESAQERLIASIEEQKGRIRSQLRQVVLAAAADQSRYDATVRGLQSEMQSLGDQVAAQVELVAVAREESIQAQTLAERGFVSSADVKKRYQAMLIASNDLARTRTEHANRIAVMEQTQHASLQASASAKAQIAGLEASLAELEQHAIDKDSARSFSLQAAIAGRITALTAREGQVASPLTPLMQIVPSDAKFTAELYVPSDAVGGLNLGADVHLAVDAYPYHEFGTLAGRITEISRTTVLRNAAGQQDLGNPVYLVSVQILPAELGEYSMGKRLLPGMSLTARVVSRKERVADILLAPLRSMTRR